MSGCDLQAGLVDAHPGTGTVLTPPRRIVRANAKMSHSPYSSRAMCKPGQAIDTFPISSPYGYTYFLSTTRFNMSVEHSCPLPYFSSGLIIYYGSTCILRIIRNKRPSAVSSFCPPVSEGSRIQKYYKIAVFWKNLKCSPPLTVDNNLVAMIDHDTDSEIQWVKYAMSCEGTHFTSDLENFPQSLTN
jgi:hypothetical protein